MPFTIRNRNRFRLFRNKPEVEAARSTEADAMHIHTALSPIDVKQAKRRIKYKSFELMPSDEPLLELLPYRQQQLLKAQGTYKERAEQLGVPVGTIRSGLHRARAALEQLRQGR
jgi:DNA-directed RNA polymerase specialized sigma24 family protein